MILIDKNHTFVTIILGFDTKLNSNDTNEISRLQYKK